MSAAADLLPLVKFSVLVYVKVKFAKAPPDPEPVIWPKTPPICTLPVELHDMPTFN